MIQLDNLCFGYSPKKMLYNNMSMKLGGGSIYGLLGKNGAGKSTLLKNIAGTLFPLSGSITVNGMSPQSRKPSFLQSIYYIAEDVYVPSLSIRKYEKLFAPFYPLFSRANFHQYMTMLGVDADSKLSDLSFGQQKKFVIAFALACNTHLLLMDEPTNGLDIPSKAQFRRLIASVMNEDRTIIISTHQVRDLENMIDSVVIIDNGDLLLNASIDQISAKLTFKTSSEIPAGNDLLYKEATFNGFSTVTKNLSSEESKLNLEHLYNAAEENPAMIKQLFNN